MKKNTIRNLFTAYILFLIVFVLLKFHGSFYEIYDRVQSIRWNRELGNWNYNLHLFQNIRKQNLSSFWFFKNLIGNTVLFIPFGVLLPMVSRKNMTFAKFLFISIIFILSIELIQFITMIGYFDIDDIVLNMLGSLSGFFIQKAASYLLQRKTT